MICHIEKVNYIISFCQKLKVSNNEIWHDEHGDYEIVIGRRILKDFVNTNPLHKLIISDFIDCAWIPLDKSFIKPKQSYPILSIGVFEDHNKAREYCKENNLEYLTAPLPLANDSFGTNRIGVPNGSSVKGGYPEKTLFDIELIEKLPVESNILGVGEFLGLYTSIIDYFSVRLKNPPERILSFIYDLTCILQTSIKKDKQSFIKNLSVALVFKILIMRISVDYQVGCGADHILANYYEKYFKLPHGKAVFFGFLMMLLIFPKWEKYGLTFHNMERFGAEMGLVTQTELNKITAIEILDLFSIAHDMRLKRKTNINPFNLDKKEIDFMRQRIKYYRGIKKWDTLH